MALAINAWCFDFKDGFQSKNYISLIEGFKEYSSLDQSETKSLNVLLRGAAVRILVTRLHDMIYHPKDALVIGRNGGSDTFDIPFVKQAIQTVLNERKDIWFIFQLTDKFIEHERE